MITVAQVCFLSLNLWDRSALFSIFQLITISEIRCTNQVGLSSQYFRSSIKIFNAWSWWYCYSWYSCCSYASTWWSCKSFLWWEHKTCNMFEMPSHQINFATRLADRLSYKFTRFNKLRNEIHLIREFHVKWTIVHFMKSRVLPQNRINFDEYFRDPREVTNISWQHLLRIFLVLPVLSS